MNFIAFSWLCRRREELLSPERFEPEYRSWVVAIPMSVFRANELREVQWQMSLLEGIAIIHAFGVDEFPVSDETLLQTLKDPTPRWKAFLEILDAACCYGEAAVQCVLEEYPPEYPPETDLQLVQAHVAMLLQRWIDVSELESEKAQRDVARVAAHQLIRKTVFRLYGNFIAAEHVPATFRKLLSALGDASGVSEAVREAFLEGYRQWHEFGRPETIERLRNIRVEAYINNGNYRAWECSGVDERYIEWLGRVPNLGVH